MPFDAAALRRIDAAYELDIESTRPDGSTRTTTIWAVVDDGEVFVRSWKGDRGYWYQAALDKPDELALIVDGERLPVRAVSANDDTGIARCSAGLSKKYRRDSSLPGMLLPRVLPTTLRLEPR
ncbi:MAG: hypothetical protein QOJ81_1369 [Chloroflexota bacterium]|nr:hypothetical protein [Chloroflexota bacterium]